MIFIDWLSVYQDFDDELPRLASEVRTYSCALTGELLKETTTGYKHEGSFDTSLLIKFDGMRLHMSGNPSSWCRKDNLFGCRSVADALEVFNNILYGLGYPRFCDDQAEFHSEFYQKTDSITLDLQGGENHVFKAKPSNADKRLNLPKKSTKRFKRGLVFTRIDITKNFSSKIPAVEMLRYLSSFSYRGQCGYLYPNGRTVEWLGSRSGEKGASKRLYFKYYDKAFDLETKLKKLISKRQRFQIKDAASFENLDFLDSQIKYVSELLQYTIENNVIRFELELKSKTLEEQGLNSLKSWSYEVMVIQLSKYLPHIKQVIQFNDKVDLFAQLVAAGIPETKARNAAALGQLWLDGHDIRFTHNPMVKRQHYYNVRKLLLLIGFDVASPLNVTHFQRSIKTVTLESLPVPDWYHVA